MDKRLDNGHWLTQITNLKPWTKNPKTVMVEDFERLKAQIVDLGVYKTILVLANDTELSLERTTLPYGTIIGGNTRYKALSDLNSNVYKRTEIDNTITTNDLRGQFNELWIAELGFEWEQATEGKVAQVYPVIDGKRHHKGFATVDQIIFMFSTSDNDQIGVYDSEAVALMSLPFQELIPMGTYKFEVRPSLSFEELIAQHAPSPLDLMPPIGGDDDEKTDITKKLSFKFFDMESYTEAKSKIAELKKDFGMENESEVLLELINSYYNGTKSEEDTTQDIQVDTKV